MKRAREILSFGKQTPRPLMLGVIGGVLAGIIGGGVLAALGQKPSPPSVVDSGFGERVSPLGALEFAHQQLLADGGALVDGRLLAATVKGSDIEVVIGDFEIRWMSPTHAFEARSPLVAVGIGVSAAEQGLLSSLPSGSRVVALVSAKGALFGIAGVIGMDDLTAFDPVPRGPFFLGSAGTFLADTGFPPIPDMRCEWSPEGVAGSQSALEAVVGYFTLLGDTSRADRVAELAAIDAEVDRLIAAAPTMTDEVTLSEVPAAINDVRRQVKAGVAEVVVRPSYPMLIELPSADPESTAVLVFADAGTGDIVSWVPLTPTGWVDDAGNTHWSTDLAVYIEAPGAGNDLEVYLRDTDVANFDCPADSGEEPVMTIPFDAAFGKHRALINVATLTVTDLSPNRFSN